MANRRSNAQVKVVETPKAFQPTAEMSAAIAAFLSGDTINKRAALRAAVPSGTDAALVDAFLKTIPEIEEASSQKLLVLKAVLVFGGRRVGEIDKLAGETYVKGAWKGNSTHLANDALAALLKSPTIDNAAAILAARVAGKKDVGEARVTRDANSGRIDAIWESFEKEGRDEETIATMRGLIESLMACYA